jgi:cytochrome c oxidase subunit 1
MMNETLGNVHFALTFVFVNVVFLPQFVLGFMGHQRRIANPDFFSALQTPEAQQLQLISTVGAVLLLLSQTTFLVNFATSLFRGKAAGRNPWRANTLEWMADSPPPHGNWPQPPTVYRGPYEYSAPGCDEDFQPQGAAS